MELMMWQNVIVDWVNCLNLSRPILCIRELKDEDFFRKLLKLLSHDQHDNIEKTISLTEFIRKHYPSYSLEAEPVLIQDDVEISYICSLLLHYCCIIDAREEFIVPLCNELSRTSQITLKSFLEKIQDSKEITRDILNDLINNMTKYLSSPAKSVKTSPSGSPKITTNTPLSEFLKTPVKKQQIFDSHKKEIKSLQAQLDFERYEKADLQEELNNQYEKNKKLDKTISDKQIEIKRLRSEILTFETRIPPSSTKTEERLENKRLRDEITSLEKYVEILHSEQEEIQNDRDKAREKLRKIEEQCNDWQDRALLADRHCSKLTEENEHYKAELLDLREKCEELSSILKELNTRNICEESFDIDTSHTDLINNRSGPIDYDSLAHTVVDVQLLDAQEENKNLRRQLGELEVNTTELTIHMNQLQIDITKMMEENSKLNKNLVDIEKEKNLCCQLITQTKNENEELKLKLAKTENELTSSQINLTTAELKNDNLKEIIDKKIVDISILSTEKSALDSENKNIKDILNKLNKNLENCLVQFGLQLKHNIENNFSDLDYILYFKNLIKILEQKNLTDAENLLELQNKITKLTENELSAQKEITNLKNILEDAEKKIKDQEIEIVKFTKVIEDLQNTIANKTAEISQLSKIKDDLDQEKLNLTTTLESLEHKLLEEKKLKELLENDLEKIKIDVKEKDCSIKILKEQKKNLERQVESLNKEITVENKIKLELEGQCTKLKNIISDVENQMTYLETDKIDLNKQLEELKQEIIIEKQTQTDLKTRNLDLQQIISEKDCYSQKLETGVKKLEKQLEDAKNFNKILQNELDSMSQFLQETSSRIYDLETEKLHLNKKMFDLEQELLEKVKVNDKFKVEYENLELLFTEKQNYINILEVEKEKTEKQLELVTQNLTTEKEEVRNKNQELQEEVNELNQFFNMVNIEISTIVKMLKTDEDLEVKCDSNKALDISDKIIDIKSKICNLIFEKRQLVEENSSFEQQISNLEMMKEEYLSKLSTLEKECEDSKVENKKNKAHLEIYRTKLNDVENVLIQSQSSIEILLSEHAKEKDDFQNTIKQLEEQNISLQEQLQQMKTIEKTINTELQLIKEEVKENKNNFKNKQQKLKKENKELAEDKHSLIKKLDEVTEDCFKLKSSIEENIKNHEKKLHQLENVQKNLQHNLVSSNKKTIHKLESKIKEKENTIKETDSKLIELADKCEMFNQEKNKMVVELLKVKTELKETIILYTQLVETEKSCKYNNEMLQAELKKIQNEKENLESELKKVTEKSNKLSLSLEENLKAYNAQLENVEKDKINLSGTLNKITDEIKRNMKEKDEKIKKLREEKNTHLKELSEIKVSLKQLEKEKLLNEISVKNLTDETKEKEAVISALNNKIREYDGVVDNLNCEKVKLFSELANIKTSVHDLEGKRSSREKIIDDLTTDIKEKDSLLTNLDLKLVESSIIIEKLDTENNKLISELSDIKQSVNVLEKKLKSHEKTNEEKNNIITNLNTELNKSAAKVDSLLLEKTKLLSEIFNMQTILTNLKEQKIVITKQLKDNSQEASLAIEQMKLVLNDSINDILSDKDNFVALYEQFTQKFNSLYSLIFESNDKEIKIKKEQLHLCKRDQIEEIYNLIFNKIIVLKKAYKDCEPLQTELSVCKTENYTLKEKISEIEHKLSTINLENIKYQKTMSEKELELKNMKKRHEEEVHLLKSASINWQEVINNNENDYTKLKEEYKIKTENMEKVIIDLKQQIKNKTGKITEFENKYDELNKEYKKATEKVSNLEVDLKITKDRYKEEINSLKINSSKLEVVVNTNEIEYRKLKDKYKTDLENLEKSISDLKHQIKVKNETIDKYESKYEELNKTYIKVLDKNSIINVEVAKLREQINYCKKAAENREIENSKLTKNYNELLEQYKTFTEKCKKDHNEEEFIKLRSAYSETLAENSRFQLDFTVLKKTIEERNGQLSNLTLIKDSYEKLLEENNKVNLEIDTLKYKRTRDKEEFKKVLEESKTIYDKQIQEFRNEYEEKLKKMKERIVKLYKEEVEKEKKKASCTQHDQAKTEETIASLRSQLWATGSKYIDLKRENEKLREQLSKLKCQQNECWEIVPENATSGSRESLYSLRESKPKYETEERKNSTLPRESRYGSSDISQSQQIDIIEESVTISRRRKSITATVSSDHGLKMEDEEGEIFNNTYLADLKEGRCVPSDARDSNSSSSSRLSELQLRNSMCLPHLKSSYPAETQFASPRHFKEDEIKMGTVDLDDSMSSSLLPGEKPRTKKDWGQTLYKKPGPPTPSKNGGRLSLQGNELQPREVLRDHNDNRSNGRSTSTPSRLKALFSRGGSTKADENEPSTPKGSIRRRYIFRK